MSKEQWGHGFHKGVASALSTEQSLVGLFFHSRKDGKIHWQGRVARDVGNGNYSVQLSSWLDGSPICQKIAPFEEMKVWDFYQTDAAMRHAWAEENGMDEDEFEHQEKMHEIWRKGVR